MNCKTCNIAAPQYELFDGLCGKCLLAQAAAMREALEKARAAVVRFLVPHRFRLSDSWLDFFVEENLVMFDAIGFVKAKPIEEDAGHDYVSKESVKPLLDALSAYRTLLYQAGESTVLADEAFMQARRIGLLKDK